MRRKNIEPGKKYLTRDVSVIGLLGRRRTRGCVEVIGPAGDLFEVRWLMRDGSERKEAGLPRAMHASELLVEVPEVLDA